MTNDNDDFLLDEIEETAAEQANVEVAAKEDVIEIPEAYQVCKMDSNNKREIVDTYKCDRVRGIMPISKAKSKAETLKRIFPKNTFVVVAIIHNVNKFNKIERVFNVINTY